MTKRMRAILLGMWIGVLAGCAVNIQHVPRSSEGPVPAVTTPVPATGVPHTPAPGGDVAAERPADALKSGSEEDNQIIK